MLVSAGGRVTTAAPQLGFFNQGSPENHPAAKGKLRWRSLETYIERNAFTMRLRVSVFAGPGFDDEKDPEYRFGVKVPMKFWKIAVWKGETQPASPAVKECPTTCPESLILVASLFVPPKIFRLVMPIPLAPVMKAYLAELPAVKEIPPLGLSY